MELGTNFQRSENVEKGIKAVKSTVIFIYKVGV